MNLLLDTHALIWWGHSDPRLREPARQAIRNPGSTTYVSAVSALEVTTKFRLGKLPEAYNLAANFSEEVARLGMIELPVSMAHGQLAGTLAIPHKDPFDRVLIAQALVENLILVSNEEIFDSFGVARLW